MKKFMLWLHKWLGLITGIVIVIVSITGCIYVFHDDIKKIVYPNNFYIDDTENLSDYNRETLSFSSLQSIAQQAVGEQYPINRVDIYPAKDRTWVFRALKTDKNATGYWNEVVFYKRIFVNPYTGVVQKVEDTKKEFFYVVLQLHRNLLLGSKIGGWVVGGSTVLFMVITITGLILWWPKKWKGKTFKRSFVFDFSVNWKRLNHDLHNLLGMYTFLLAIVIGMTGVLFAFPKFRSAVEITLNKVDEDKFQVMESTAFYTVPQITSNTLDNAVFYALDKFGYADMMSIRLSKDEKEPHSLQIRLEQDKTSKFEWLYFDKKSGDIVTREDHTYTSIALGTKVNSLNFDLHVGTIWGYPTKILAFIGSLIFASLPVTGLIIWLNKQKKSKKRSR
ncbi:PepSY domain-containing protein [Myroides odoratimimus]|uniref:PepSY-associated TM helix domain-containing protein n=1 Tax=Myroides odoratimimus TaxID=76832 RepID=UPI00103B0178|nr:PepSY-associated TM helix domain-containing protein [Myroides odoratimimus]MCO7723277.1 PepSY domain-containing protein [Myroides odoratimimus]MDM1033577.1 PepSY domain-containing protein [Myroides odoratimimus]MDM1039297.1 PepSY domain-containing protein [Myroides odoratimimus]MDM1053520.1 PepSY domain-containing protein [Myroides odoratimimus]MDM1066127.1 PepSY domain-containing protein [Myroides odoratimimus]